MAIYVHQNEVPVYTNIDTRQITTTSRVSPRRHVSATFIFS